MKTVIEMAKEAGFENLRHQYWDCTTEGIEAFAELVRADAIADEREACANLVFHSPPSDEYESPLMAVYKAIRNRSST